MQIGGLQKLTLIDYPGKLACTVFCTGCLYRCPWCYNPELVLPEKIRSQPKISEKEFFDFLGKRKELLDGVVLGGGEPTINQELPAFCQKIKNLGYFVKLDTNGSNPKMIRELIDRQLADYIALDVKAPPEKYARVTGIENKIAFGGMRLNFWEQRIVGNIEKSINILRQGKTEYELRTTVIPKLLTRKDILRIAKWISPAPRYFLQNFRPEKTIDPEFEKIKPYSLKYLVSIRKAIAPFFDTCEIRE